MKIVLRNIREVEVPCDMLLLPVLKGGSQTYSWLGQRTAEYIYRAFSKEFQGENSQVLYLQTPEKIKPKRLLLVGLGEKNKLSPEKLRQAGGTTAKYLNSIGMENVALSGKVFLDNNHSPVDFIEGFLLGQYRFKLHMDRKEKKGIRKFTLLIKKSRQLSDDLHWKTTTAEAVAFARDLVNTPSNKMTPSHLAVHARSLKSKKLSITILEKAHAQKLGMEAYLSVTKGSSEKPRFIILNYKGAKGNPIVLIGKSVTFDSGGISLKPANGMERMKDDMAGGAAVLAVLQAVSQLNVPAHVIGILPATENLPDGSASKPGDIVRSMRGKTIEIISTDAEGRMTLADALEYAQRYRPRAIIDIATLTGACAITFGNEVSAMMGNDRTLLEAMERAGETTNERVWEMPLLEDYREHLKSDVADLKNTGGKSGSLMTSASFLSEFVGKTPWIHLDIAGTAWSDKDKPYIPKGASGFGVRLLARFVKELR
jgi:leucyl aminopeptidase